MGSEMCIRDSIKDLFDNLSLLPANRNLAGAEIELMTVDKMQFIMKENLQKVRRRYDFIIIDCPPALGMLTVNAMTAANTVIVPIQCEFYALDGLTQLIYTCLLYTSDAADEEDSVDLGGRRIIKKNKEKRKKKRRRQKKKKRR